MTARPAVTALVPAWNAEAFIASTLDSLAAQDYPALRVLISVDASTDRTAEVCERYAVRDARFRVLRQGVRLGWVGNVNALLAQAETPYGFFAFHDDLLDADYVSSLARLLEADHGAVVAFSDMDTADEAGELKVQRYTALAGVADPVERARRILEKAGAWWAPHRGLFRVQVAREIGGLRRHLAGEFSADWPWLLHLALRGSFVREPRTLCHKRYMMRSLSREWGYTSVQNLAVTLSCLREVLRARVPVRVKVALLPGLAARCVRWSLRPLAQRLGALLAFRSSRNSA